MPDVEQVTHHPEQLERAIGPEPPNGTARRKQQCEHAGRARDMENIVEERNHASGKTLELHGVPAVTGGVERRQGHVMMLAKHVQAVLVSERDPTLH